MFLGFSRYFCFFFFSFGWAPIGSRIGLDSDKVGFGQISMSNGWSIGLGAVKPVRVKLGRFGSTMDFSNGLVFMILNFQNNSTKQCDLKGIRNNK